MDLLKRLVSRLHGRAVPAGVAHVDRPPIDFAWRDGMSMRIPDWNAMWQAAPRDASDAVQEAYWGTIGVGWLEALKDDLGAGYTVAQSPHFALLGAVQPPIATLALETCERFRNRILRALPGLAIDEGFGPYLVVIFDSQDRYYDYIGNYYPEPGEYAQSSGVFIHHGYSHFVFFTDAMWNMESVIAHELTHCFVRHLPLPAWLNEGIAVNMEKRLNPNVNQPRTAMLNLVDIRKQRQSFWNASTIQEFWNGKSFLRPDEGSSLSYDLGENIVSLLAKDFATFARFATGAVREDAGAASAREVFDLDLGDCAAAVLGAGDWTPRPSLWSGATERGQFRPLAPDRQ